MAQRASRFSETPDKGIQEATRKRGFSCGHLAPFATSRLKTAMWSRPYSQNGRSHDFRIVGATENETRELTDGLATA
jgi:hypothetical protein